jgi:hypothetical protein
MRRWLFLLLLVPLAGCGVQPTGMIYAGDPAVARQAVPPTTVYFARKGRLYEVQRQSVPGAPQAALDQLTAGPTPAEYAAGIHTFLPPWHLRVQVQFGEADIYVDQWILASALAQAQVVCTTEAQPDVHKVELIIGSTELVRSCSSYPDLKPVSPTS